MMVRDYVALGALVVYCVVIAVVHWRISRK